MIEFFVPGTPISKGSAKSFFNNKTQRIVTMQDNRDRQKPWASLISYTAQEAGCRVMVGGVSLSCRFVMPRPKGHYGTGKKAAALKMTAPSFHTVKPDMDKLLRCVKDALTGVAWKDDSQVCHFGEMSKRYGEQPGVWIRIEDI